MGAYLSRPIFEPDTVCGSGHGMAFGASSVQGWRVTQEDAHNCILDFDKDCSLFAVYDGHGGSEVNIIYALLVIFTAKNVYFLYCYVQLTGLMAFDAFNFQQAASLALFMLH